MEKIKFHNEYIHKNCGSEFLNYNEFLSMKKISEIFGFFNHEKFIYRSLKVFEYNREYYSMEYIKGKTISQLYWETNDYKIFKHAGKWLAFYTNKNSINGFVPAIADFVSNNIMLSNNEVILIDQPSAHKKNQKVEEILSYFISRQNFENTLHFRLFSKNLNSFLESFFKIQEFELSRKLFLIHISKAHRHLLKKIFCETKFVNGLIFTIPILISFITLKLRIKNWRKFT